MKKKGFRHFGAAVVLVASLALAACSQATKTAVDQQATIETNFYQAVNKDWLENTSIPENAAAYSISSAIQEKIDQQLNADIEKMVAGKIKTETSDQKEFIKLYQKAMDFKQREKDGVSPLQPRLDTLSSLTSFDDVAKKSKEMTLQAYYLPFGILIGSNPENTNQRLLELIPPSSLLPDPSYYEDEDTKKEMLELYSSTAIEVVQLFGYSEKEAQKMVEEAIAFDALIVPYLPSSEEANDSSKLINLRTKEEINAYAPSLSLGNVMESLVGQEVARANVAWPEYFEVLDKLLTKEHFSQYQSWTLMREMLSSANMLTEKVRQTAGQYSLALSGQKELVAKEDVSYQSVTGIFSETLSLYYNQHYFSEEAKNDVANMVEGIIAAYKQRLKENDWLSEETKAEAIKKLDKLEYHIGYQDSVSESTKEILVDESASYFDTVLAIQLKGVADEFANYNEEIDKSQWGEPSYQVNAFYAPDSNAIYLPAAILQAPFYDKNQSDAANYGGIGAVIGHEISHAFDSNGAEYDEVGNRRNWWTDADRKAFEEKTQAMVDEFDGLEIYGGKVNGKLTVTENTADAGGLSVSLEVLKAKDKNTDLKAFFENYATIWRQVITDQLGQYLLAIDPHAPDELRVNIQIQNLDDFYATYDSIKEGDPMYRAPDKRVHIW